MTEVLERDKRICFEIIGGPQIRKMFSILPRVHVTHPMSWESYQSFISRPGRDIGLAPLLNTPFNAARAPTKFFDITHTSAVGIYSDVPIYSAVIEHEKNGILVPNTPSVWVEQIISLASSKQKREALLSNARGSC